MAFSIAGFMAIVFSIVFSGFMSWGQVLTVAPLVNVLYLINAYYGMMIKDHTEK